MCGIVGAVRNSDASGFLLEGLRRLEYRGYDSAGVVIINQDGDLERARTVGKVAELEHALNQAPLMGMTGIAHTRWATTAVSPNPTPIHISVTAPWRWSATGSSRTTKLFDKSSTKQAWRSLHRLILRSWYTRCTCICKRAWTWLTLCAQL